jgi:hypothetical protein
MKLQENYQVRPFWSGGKPAEIDHCGDCSTMEDFKTIGMVFLYFELREYLSGS